METESFIKQVPIAITAVMAHVIEHDLPFPNAHLDTDVHTETLDIALFGLSDEDHARWMNSLFIESEENEEKRGGSIRSKWHVRLPDSGVGFVLVTYRQAPFLKAVSA